MTDAREPHDLHPATRTVAAGRPDRQPGAPVNPPLVFTSTYIADGPVDYARVSNPTWEPLEETLGSLEGGRALAFGSGLAAVAAVLALVPHGGVVVAPRHAYSGTLANLAEREAAGGVQVRRVDIADADQVEAALEGADLLLLETATNPMLEVPDLPRLAAAARAAGTLTVCDNTFATPLLRQPLADGVDVVLHSVTKYLAGHSDLVLGATVTADTEQGRELHERLHRHRTLAGAIPGPMEAWLALRGMRTLDVRLERAGRTAALIAERAAGHPAVTKVRYPGWGAIVAIEVDGAEAGERVAGAVRVWTHSTSLGGVESQLERRRRHAAEADTVPEGLLRLSVGIEHAEDLWADLAQALDAASASRG
ncbi:trans-sulfuration enzyme family protein [Ornithinicoccus halotolerans]|uniref:trans-sulfuration enzyme family protein n=1 Tax=Ornithinicoccus halotolerans TaxID=1748220 RepID=UPI0012979E13|nr:PLP-dependent aspartate aminotransferase family protein [Ornithinicoccus halotolerans]